MLLLAGDGQDGDQPGGLTHSNCTQPLGNQLEWKNQSRKTAPPRFTTLVKHETSLPRFVGQKSVPPKWITDYWDDDEWKKEDEESRQWEEEKHQKKPTGPILSLDEHEESVTALTSKTAPSQVSQASRLPGQTPSASKRSQSKV